MLFHTSVFAVFLSIVLILFLTLKEKWLTWMMIIASYVFYGWVEPKYTILMLGSSIVDFLIAQHFSKPGLQDKDRVRGIWLSALFNFGILFYYKYTNFAIDNAYLLLNQFGFHLQKRTLEIVLPLGISFYTFHTFSYSVDVLTEKIPPCRSLSKFLLFVAWFPQLVAGPIARAESLMPELDNFLKKRFKMVERIPEAMILFSEGWLRKAFADWTSLTSDHFFNGNIAAANSFDAAFGIIAFGLQIYGDFSGYSRMAQGVSWLFGVRLVPNFNLPYIAKSPQDFWQRWHISLSTWLRDYLFTPLAFAGSRSKYQLYFAIMATFTLSGLWHGANWTFVIFGVLHGLMILSETVAKKFWKKMPVFIAIPFMWVLVFFAFVPFRVQSVAQIGTVFRALFSGGHSLPLPNNLLAGLIGIVFCDVITKYLTHTGVVDTKGIAQTIQRNWAAASLATVFLIWYLNDLLWQVHEASFIYFQF